MKKETVDGLKPYLKIIAEDWVRLEVLERDYIEAIAKVEGKSPDEIEKRLFARLEGAKRRVEIRLQTILGEDIKL